MKLYGNDGKNMEMTRGDTEIITVSCLANGIDMPLQIGDIVYFTVKETINSSSNAFQVKVTEFTTEGKAEIKIKPENTKNLKFRTYVYDVQITKADGTVTTIITPHEFKIGAEVTNE